MSQVSQSQLPKFRLARRLDGVSESATLKLNARVQALKTEGVDVINLTAGEPDFNVPDAAKQAVIDALNANKSKYTPVPGIPELRKLIAEKTNAQQPKLATMRPWKPENVVVTNGGKHALFNVFMAMLDPGDEVLIPSPYWLSYPEMVKLAGGIPQFIHAPFSQGFKIRPEQLRAALTGPTAAKIKALIINSPGNPTGAMYSKAEFEALAQVLRTTPGAENVWVVSDEIYDRIELTRAPFTSFLEAAPDLRDRVVTVNGMSKSSAMTGWRVGWTVCHEALTQGMITMQGQSTSNVNSLAQWASVAALRLPEAEFASQVESFKRRRELCLDILSKAGKIDIFPPEGAFYVFFGVGKCMKQGEDSFSFAERLLEEARVAVIPGTPFGEPEFVRISFATDERSLQEGCSRIVKFLQNC